MAIALDASTPAYSGTFGGTVYSAKITTGAQFTQTSASFTPPSGSLAAVLAASTTATAYAALGITVADSASNAYTLSPAYQVSVSGSIGSVAIFTHYYASSPGTVTVISTLAAAESAAGGATLDMMPLVLTGAASSQAGAGNAALFMSSSLLAQEIPVTTTAAGSWVVVIGVNWTGGSGFSAPDAQTVTYGAGADASYAGSAFGYSAAPTGTPGPTTFGWTQVTADKATLAALEILPAGTMSNPEYAASYDIISGGAGSWVNPANAEGAPDTVYATWTAP